MRDRDGERERERERCPTHIHIDYILRIGCIPNKGYIVRNIHIEV